MKFAQVKVFRNITGDRGKVVFAGSLLTYLKSNGFASWEAQDVKFDVRERGSAYVQVGHDHFIVEPA